MFLATLAPTTASISSSDKFWLFAKAAIKASVAASPFPPQICDIREYATRMTGQRRMTADEAWGIAAEVIRAYSSRTVPIEGFASNTYEFVKFGEPVKARPSGLEYEAKRHCPKDVWEILERMGYADVCASENPDVVRGQFMRAWSNHDKEEYEKKLKTALILKEKLDGGISLAKAKFETIKTLGGNFDERLIGSPNNILGLEPDSKISILF